MGPAVGADVEEAAVGKVGTVDSGADELHDGIVAVGMSALSGED